MTRVQQIQMQAKDLLLLLLEIRVNQHTLTDNSLQFIDQVQASKRVVSPPAKLFVLNTS